MTDFTDEGFVAIDDGNGNWVVQPGWNVTFDANGGDPTPAAQRIAAGGTATAPTAPTKANYSFRAWQTNGVDWVFTDAVPSDLTLVADWTIDSFDVIWVADGATVLSNRLDYGATITAPATDPTKAGDDGALYTFVGWTPAPDATVTSNATYTADFKTWAKVAVPEAETGLVYDGTEKTGVVAGAGYTLTDNTGVNASNYVATVTLADPANTVWATDAAAPTATTNQTVAWSIASATVTVAADNASKKHGEDDPVAFTATVSGLFGSDTVAYTVGREAGEEIGTYTITATGAEVQGNYTVAYENGTFTIVSNAHTLTIVYMKQDDTPAAATYEVAYEYGAAYRVESPEVEGYTPTLDVVEGTMGTEDVSVTVTYVLSSGAATVISVADNGATTNVVGVYETFAQAVEAARDGDTVVLLDDCIVGTSRIDVSDKSFTVDLNGWALGSEEPDAIVFSVSNGQTLTINGTTEDSTLLGSVMIPRGGEGHIVVNGGTYQNDLYTPFYANGLCSEGSTISITGATIVANDTTPADSDPETGFGLYIAGPAAVTLTDTEITAAKTGVEIRAGSLAVNGGSITANGAFSTNPSTNGGTVNGAAIAVSPHSTNKPIEVQINGGRFEAEKAVYENYLQTQSRTAETEVTLAGGTFVGDVEIVEDLGTVIPGDSEALFSDRKADGVADGYMLVLDDDSKLYSIAKAWVVTWKVGETTVQTNVVAEGTTQAQVEALAPTDPTPGDGSISTFVGWEPPVSGPVESDVVYVAKFEQLGGVSIAGLTFTSIRIDGTKVTATFTATMEKGEKDGIVYFDRYDVLVKRDLADAAPTPTTATLTLGEANGQLDGTGVVEVNLPYGQAFLVGLASASEP